MNHPREALWGEGLRLFSGRRRFGLNLRWPKRLKGSCLQSSGFLLIGLFWSTSIFHRLARTGNQPTFRQTHPVLAFCLVFSLAMLWLLVG